MLAIVKYLKGIENADVCKELKTIKLDHDSNARADTNIDVFVKRLFCRALLSCCEASLPCRDFPQMPMQQPHITSIRIKVYGVQIYTECLNETKLNNAFKTAEIRGLVPIPYQRGLGD